MQLFARIKIEKTGEEGALRRVLGKWDLTALGVGATIGAGIFAATGSAIAGGHDHVGAGPAIVTTCGPSQSVSRAARMHRVRSD